MLDRLLISLFTAMILAVLYLCIGLKHIIAAVLAICVHEIGHFINGDSKQKFIDFESAENVKETKANLFAENTLIEKNAYCNFVNAQNFSLSAIKAFAKTQNILPTIVIGRLQNDSYLKWSDFTDEIVKYEKM